MANFEIEFSNSNGIVIFSVLLFISMILYRIKLTPISLGFTASNSNQAQGIFIAVVIIHHISQRLTSPGIDNFIGYGYLAVGVFFLLSGYGLVKSLKKHKGYLQGFIEKKTVAILLPFFLINALVSSFFQIVNEHGLTDFFLYITSLKLIDSTSWFVISIFIFYAAFYVTFTWFKQGKEIIALFVFTGLYIGLCRYLELGGWVYRSALCFPVGALIGRYEDLFNFWLQKLKLSWFAVVGSVLTILVILVYPEVLWRIPSPVTCVLFSIGVYLVLSVAELNSPLSELMGKLSLDAYLIHMKLMLLFSYLTMVSSFLWCAFYLLSLIALSLAFNQAHKRLGSYVLMRITNASSRS